MRGTQKLLRRKAYVVLLVHVMIDRDCNSGPPRSACVEFNGHKRGSCPVYEQCPSLSMDAQHLRSTCYAYRTLDPPDEGHAVACTYVRSSQAV